MKTYKNVEIKTQELDSVFCNICGREIPRDKFNEFADYLEIDKTWGYNSPFDNEHHLLDICITCYKDIIQNVKIPFNID